MNKERNLDRVASKYLAEDDYIGSYDMNDASDDEVQNLKDKYVDDETDEEDELEHSPFLDKRAGVKEKLFMKFSEFIAEKKDKADEEPYELNVQYVDVINELGVGQKGQPHTIKGPDVLLIKLANKRWGILQLNLKDKKYSYIRKGDFYGFPDIDTISPSGKIKDIVRGDVIEVGKTLEEVLQWWTRAQRAAETQGLLFFIGH